jgi:murein DD-endopeptidase MepM/ murein hydrolase activator NlpD
MMFALASVAALVWSGDATADSRYRAMLQPPVSASCISSPFGPRVLPNLPLAGTYHYGVDLPAPVGAPVLSPASGTVIRVQNKIPGGLEMLVQHNGFVGIYSHFGMITPAFAQGKVAVLAGEKLGVVGNTGITSGTHLYFEMVLDGKPIDPAPYLGLPYCSGEVHQTQTQTRTAPPDADWQTLVGRQYFQVSAPARQYYQWQQH